MLLGLAHCANNKAPVRDFTAGQKALSEQTYCAIVTETVTTCRSPASQNTDFAYRCFDNTEESACQAKVQPQVSNDNGVCDVRRREWVSGGKPQPGTCQLYLAVQNGLAECASPGGDCGSGRTCDDRGICRCTPGKTCPCTLTTLASRRCEGNTIVSTLMCANIELGPDKELRELCGTFERCVETTSGAVCEGTVAPPK